MGHFLSVLRNRNLSLLLAGRVVSVSGDWLFQIALSVAVFPYSPGKAIFVGLLWIVRIIPSLLLAPFGGALADRVGGALRKWAETRSATAAAACRCGAKPRTSCAS